MALAEVLKITRNVREVVIKGARGVSSCADALNLNYTIRRQRGESDSNGIRIGYPTNSDERRRNKVSAIYYTYFCSSWRLTLS
jgi:hypothetical protein